MRSVWVFWKLCLSGVEGRTYGLYGLPLGFPLLLTPTLEKSTIGPKILNSISLCHPLFQMLAGHTYTSSSVSAVDLRS